MRVRLFAGLRTQFGETIDLPVPTPCTAKDVIEALVSKNCWQSGTRLAVDLKFALDDEVVGPDSELAAIPPVTGG